MSAEDELPEDCGRRGEIESLYDVRGRPRQRVLDRLQQAQAQQHDHQCRAQSYRVWEEAVMQEAMNEQRTWVNMDQAVRQCLQG